MDMKFCTKTMMIILLMMMANATIVFASYKEYDPLLVVTVMVKNEEEVVCKTLQPFIDARINSFLILDTGSTDNTIEITQQFFKDNDVSHGHIVQEPFIDFATSRNRALELTEQTFSHAAFIIMPDAEWYMHHVEGLIFFCKECIDNHEEYSSYLVRIMNNDLDFYTPRLIRCNRDVRFVGVVHEVLNKVTNQKVPSDIYFKLDQSRKGREKSAKRWVRDCDLLLKEYWKNPFHPRTLFYLAQTYACLGDWRQACHYYTLRTNVIGWDEEDFLANYRLAQTIEQAMAFDSSYLWSDALYYYLKAYQLRPHRAEPLIRITQHYWDTKEMDLCFLFARRATEIPYPEKDILFIEKELYTLTRYDLLGRCAWYISEYTIGEWAARKVLEEHPDMIHLHKNLAFYITRKEHEFLEQIEFA